MAIDDDLSPQQRAERDVGKVVTSDMIARAEAGRPEPPEGHDVRDYLQRPDPSEVVGPDPDRDALKAEIKAELLAELRRDTESGI